MAEKKHCTFNIDIEVKRQFQIEVVSNDGDMSATVELLMKSYTNTSRKIKASQVKPEIPLHPEGRVEHTENVEGSGRLEFKDE
jgi:hypothetical protein